MALVLFESRVNMITAATPSIGGFLVAYDTLDGVLKQKDDQGVITAIGSGGGIGSLSQTLSIGKTTGTNSIYLDVNSGIKSSGGSASLRLDNGSPGNYVELSSSNLTTGSTLTMNDTTIQLRGLSSSIQMSTTDIRLNFGVNQFLLQNNNYYLQLGNTRVLEFTTSTASRASGNRVPAFISSNGSRFSNTVINSVIIGGSGITGTQSNSVYTPNLIIKDGGYVKGTIGDGQLKFNSNNEAYLTSLGRIIGILNSKNNLVTDYSGIFITDVDNEFITQTEKTNITFISSSNATVGAGLYNTVVVGGKDLIIDSTDTVYLGGTVDINNQYKLPLSDGTSGQVIKTDGGGNLSWSSGVGTPVITVTAATFAGLSSFSSSSTYRITGVDPDLYGGTEIYLTTNSQGILNDVGEGKFYNPKYDQTVDGYRIWGGTSSSYATASVVYWGGRAWSNNSGTNTSSPLTIFFLNPTEWTVIPYTNGLYYRISYDKIKYDRATDKIIYRNERGTNIVSTNSENIRYWIDDIGLYDPIKVFQWGNVYSSTTAVGIASQNIVNSYNENINFRGILQTNITMNNLSSQFNMNTGTSSLQDNLILNNYSYDRQSTLLGSEYNMSFQSGYTITIDGNLMVKGSTTTISSENLIIKDPIIVLAASQSGTPTLDTGLFVDRGIGATQAFIWDESMDEFKFISTLDGADVSGDISIANYSNVRTGVLKVGTGDFDSNDRFIVSSTTGSVSFVVDNGGNIYNYNSNISANTKFGYAALYLNTTGTSNTSFGNQALKANTTGSYNTAVGVASLVNNDSGYSNTAVGMNSLYSNTTGYHNTALGYISLYSNTTGSDNTALGYQSLFYNTTGYNNTAIGEKSSYNNTTATNSVAIGYSSLYKNNIGNFNTAVGVETLKNSTTRVTSLAATFSAGSGYTPGTWPHIVLFGVAGSPYYPGGNVGDYPQVTIVVGAGGTVSSVTLTSEGSVLPDATVQFGIQTGSQYYQIPGSGFGFRINIASIKIAGSDNTALGYHALNNVFGGARNTALGSLAGSNYGYLADSNDSVYIGYNANSVNFNVSNEIVIGTTALGNGSNTVTLGNDNIQKTILKGNVAVGFTGTSVSPNCDLEVKGHQTFTLPDNNMTSGDVVYFGNVTTGLTPGSIYYYDAGDWTVADASLETSSSGLLAIALGTSSSDGMLLRGFARFDLSAVYSAMTTLGTVQFLSVTAGEFEEAQPVSSGEVVRVIGYCVDTSLLYFCPDTTWIELL